MPTEDLASLIGNTKRNNQNTDANLGFIDSEPTTILEFAGNTFMIENTRIRTLKLSITEPRFTYGHPTFGKTNSTLLKSATHPFIWDIPGTLWDSAYWDVGLAEYSVMDVWNEGNVFKENFSNNRFKSSSTTANWDNNEKVLSFA